MYTSRISKKVDTTYAHACREVGQLEDQGYVESETQGRKKVLQLTQKGEDLADNLINLTEITGDLNTARTSGALTI